MAVSEEFIDFVKRMSSASSTSDIIEFNDLSIKLENKLNNEALNYFFKVFNNISNIHIKSIQKDSFQWSTTVGKELKEFFMCFENLKSPLFVELANCTIFDMVFDIRYMQLICQVNIGRVGGSPHYDESLRAMSYMLRFFINVYLRKGLAFKPFLKSGGLHLYDPCFREKLREQNQSDPEIIERFFTERFNIKDFVYLCLSSYFPNVSWRWLGGKQFAHYMTLKMVLILFEYGLWKLEELEQLLTKIYSVSEILCNLETYIKRDTEKQSFSSVTITEWVDYATKCRKKIGSIFLHIILMYLDTEVTSSLPRFDIAIDPFFASYPLFVPKSNVEIENLFYVKRFKKKRLYIYFSYSLVTYLIRPMVFDSTEPVESDSLTKILELLVGYVSEMENNIFNISLNTLQPESFSFYVLAGNSPIYDVPKQHLSKLKNIVDQVKKCAYGALSFENSRFLTEISDAFKQITAFFSMLPHKMEVIYGFQLAYTLMNIPQYVLSLIHFIIELGAKEKTISRTVRTGVNTLIAICRGNNQAINNIFSHYNFTHIEKLMKMDVSNGAFLIAKLFGKSSTLYILEKNHDIFKKLITNFQKILGNLMERMEEKNTDKMLETDPNTLSAVMIYSKLFRRILKNSQQKDFKFQILICDEIWDQIVPIFDALANKSLKPVELFENDPSQFRKIENFLKYMQNWDTISIDYKNILVHETLYLILCLFNHSINKVYTSSIYNHLKEYFTTNKLTTFISLTSTKYGLRLFQAVQQIYSSILIFHQNHLLDRTNLLITKNNNKVEEYIRPEQLDNQIYEEMLAVNASILKAIEKFGLCKEILDLLHSGIMPNIFKLYSGLLTHMTEDKFKELRSERRLRFVSFVRSFLDFVTNIQEQMKNMFGPKTVSEQTNVFISTFKALKKTLDPLYFYKETLNAEVDTFRVMGYQLIDTIFSFYMFNEKKVPYISELVRYNQFTFEDSTINVMRDKLEFFLKFRNEGEGSKDRHKIPLWDKTRKCIQALREMHIDTNSESTSFYKQIKNFEFDIPEEDNLKFIKSLAINASGNKLTSVTELENTREWQSSYQSKDNSNIILYFKERYKYMKAYFLDNDNNNQIFIVLRLEDIMRQNVQTFVDYFVKQINEMDISFDNLKTNFFTNDYYFSLIILMDNLIRTSPNYRQSFYNKVNNDPDSGVIQKIWNLHEMLLNYCLFSTFLDSSWQKIFTCYYLISNFIQNLCEDNFYQFKTWFCENKNDTDGSRTLIEDYYMVIENALKNTELSQYTRQQLSIMDRPELFFVYNRLVEGMTEFINGGKTIGQEIVYQKRIDIYVGIIMRVVDDVDSSFYVLKYNILLYICATLEGLDKKIVEFVASNFSVKRTLNLIVRIIKKLYIRQTMLKTSRKMETYDAYGRLLIREVTEEIENTHSIESYDILMDYYTKYEATFSDHVMINTLVLLYSFMLDMGSMVVRYKNFLDEINCAVEITFSKNKNFVNEAYEMESLIVWKFIKSIIVEMEIIYKESNDEDVEPELFLHQFKKLPVCFFLTESVKENFLESVNIESIDMKHDEFFQKKQYHLTIMHDLRVLYKKSKFLFYASTEDAFRKYLIFMYLLAVIINILFLILFDNNSKNFFEWNPLSLHLSVTILAVIDSSLAFILMIFWFFVKYPTIKRIKWENYNLVSRRTKKISASTWIKIAIVESILMKSTFRSFFLHLIFSVLGLFVSPFFYSLLLLLIVDLSALIYSVVISFVKNYDKLAYTLLMIVVIINFFSYLASEFFEGDFHDEEDPSRGLMCETFFTCLMNGLNVGLRAGSGMADKMTFNSNSHSQTFEGRFFFDIMFFILVNIILLGMFFGIIVDSFKEYRDKMEVRRQDRENTCFVCGMSRDKLEKAHIEFKEHQKKHDIWNYLFYIAYLRWKPKNSYDGVDLYVSDKMDSGKKREWMPIGQTLDSGKVLKDDEL